MYIGARVAGQAAAAVAARRVLHAGPSVETRAVGARHGADLAVLAVEALRALARVVVLQILVARRGRENRGLLSHSLVSISQFWPVKPGLQVQLHCHGCWQVPWRQPGWRAHSSQRSPCQPCRHTHSPGDSQKPCSSLHPAAQMADGRRGEGTQGEGGQSKKEREREKGGRKPERILLRGHPSKQRRSPLASQV
ncbi:hypothetical protein EYF80_018693 [Liparis tanakae]|uniref:Uncharacterized protein n=1 Tax=Liparis tanakae TaxID=230148 RepID=A0A4Z2I1B2_9TELE|nr:hypothetical protein EYF80_018693 [Liparis tanakae]